MEMVTFHSTTGLTLCGKFDEVGNQPDMLPLCTYTDKLAKTIYVCLQGNENATI
jgi:hypothetical protein